MARVGRGRNRRPSAEELRHEAALMLEARINAGKPASEARRRSRPAWATSAPATSWYRSATADLPRTTPSTRPLVLHAVDLAVGRRPLGMGAKTPRRRPAG